MRQADSHESLEFPIRANHSIRANRANRFARITPLRRKTFEATQSGCFDDLKTAVLQKALDRPFCSARIKGCQAIVRLLREGKRGGFQTGGFRTFQKNPRVRKIRVRNSGAGNGCANFMGTWKNCVLSAGKPMSIKFLVLGGGVFWVWGGGGEVPILFLWARGFF